MELTGIIVGLLVLTAALVAAAGTLLHDWAAGHRQLLWSASARAGELAGRLRRRGRPAGRPRDSERERGQGTLVLLLVLGLVVVTLLAVGVGKLVEDVTQGDGVAVLDHPVADFVAGHRTPGLTTVMRAASSAGGPAGMAVLAAVAGLLLGVAWRSWTPVLTLAVTAAGVVGLTVAFKTALGRSRPPLAEAVAAADGYGFPSGHAATAAAVCCAIAWLCSLRLRSWRARTAVWAVAAVLAALVGISRVYLGVHWTTDVLGGWVFGVLWAAVVLGGWTAVGRVTFPRR